MELMKAGDVEEEEEEEEEEEVVQQQQQQQQQHFHVLAVDDSLLERKVLEKLLTISSSCEGKKSNPYLNSHTFLYKPFYNTIQCPAVTCVDSGDKALRYLGLLDDLDNFSSPFSPPRLSQQQVILINFIYFFYYSL